MALLPGADAAAGDPSHPAGRQRRQRRRRSDVRIACQRHGERRVVRHQPGRRKPSVILSGWTSPAIDPRHGHDRLRPIPDGVDIGRRALRARHRNDRSGSDLLLVNDFRLTSIPTAPRCRRHHSTASPDTASRRPAPRRDGRRRGRPPAGPPPASPHWPGGSSRRPRCRGRRRSGASAPAPASVPLPPGQGARPAR